MHALGRKAIRCMAVDILIPNKCTPTIVADGSRITRQQLNAITSAAQSDVSTRGRPVDMLSVIM